MARRKSLRKSPPAHGLKRALVLFTTTVFVVALMQLLAPNIISSSLNLFGLRGSIMAIVVDADQSAALADVAVSIDGVTERSNRQGEITFSDIKLGRQTITVSLNGYEAFETTVNIGWRSNATATLSLRPIGMTFNFTVQDWLSGLPIEGSQITFDSRRTFTNDEGKAFLTIEAGDKIALFSISADSYRQQSAELSSDATDGVIGLVIDKTHFFIGRERDRENVVAIAPDGTSRAIFLSGNSDTTSGMQFALQPNKQHAALVASAAGSHQSQLTIVELETQQLSDIEKADYIQLIGWIDDHLVYIKQNEADTQDSERYSLMTYDSGSAQSQVLAASNGFHDVLTTETYVYYVPSEQYKADAEPKLYRTRPDVDNSLTILERDVWSIVRTGINDIFYFSDNRWFVGSDDGTAVRLVDIDKEPVERLYTRNPHQSHIYAWVEFIDGVGKLRLEDKINGKNEVIVEQPGLRDPLVWLDGTHLVYRVTTDDETADYIVSTRNGSSSKITDVSDVPGVDDWYYYYD